MRKALRHVVATWLAGLFVLLPLALTVAALAWLVALLNSFIGPDTLVGKGFALLGYPLARNDAFAYFLGTVMLIGAIYLLGLLVQAGMLRALADMADRGFRAIPVIGKLYAFAEKLVGLVDAKPRDELAAMGAVWCFFGGEGGVAVLGLAPSPNPISLNGRDYFGVLVPTAPVPIGGALLYVPVDWVKPANIGIDTLTAVYVSMGLTPPVAAVAQAPSPG